MYICHVEENGRDAWYRCSEADLGEIRKAARAGVLDIKELLLAKGEVSWAEPWSCDAAAINDLDVDDLSEQEIWRGLVKLLGPAGALEAILKQDLRARSANLPIAEKPDAA